ncbi:MAG: hypothetical protein ABI573_01845 [Chloroflexota bacterium]
MNKHVARFAGTFVGLALAVSVAMPALASAGPARLVSDPAMAPLSADADVARCRPDWQAAKDNRTLAKVQAVGFCEIDRRLVTIDRLQALVRGSDVLTDAHATALTRILDHSETGLKALRREIAADTTVASATEDVRRIFTEYRIYALVTRQVVLVRADDRVDAAVNRLTHASDRLAAAIARAVGNGKDVTVAQGHLDAMTAAIGDARAEVAGDATAVLAQTPATWNAGTAKPVLDAARASIGAARSDLRTAMAEARAVLAALR